MGGAGGMFLEEGHGRKGIKGEGERTGVIQRGRGACLVTCQVMCRSMGKLSCEL